MRVATAGLLVLVACSKSTAPAAQTPAEKEAPKDVSMFPASWPALRDAEAATDPPRALEAANKALEQIAEEHELSVKDKARDRAYARLVVRMRIIKDNALIGTGRSLEALADVVSKPFACPKVPASTHDACDSLNAALATAFPNVVTAPGQITQVDQSLVVDDATSEGDLSAFVKKASALQGSVVQRMRVTSAGPGVLKIGTQLQLRIAAKQKLGAAGEVVWVAFEPRHIRHVGKTWDLDKAHVLFVEAR
jgi:hypothetical protein